MRTIRNILIVKDEVELTAEFTKIFVASFVAAIEVNGRFTVCLSGGSTPRKLYEHISGISLEWDKVFFFFGDERCVPPDSIDSNFRMASDALLTPLQIGSQNVFRWKTELAGPESAASDYGGRLTDFFGGTPAFDLCLLGLGTDGHTASLFPNTKALSKSDTVAVANWVPTFNAYRLTLTAEILNNSSKVLFIASGSEKAAAVIAVIEGERSPENYPAQLIKPRPGTLLWLIDESAAVSLSEP